LCCQCLWIIHSCWSLSIFFNVYFLIENVWSDLYVLFVLSSSCVPHLASFSGLSIFNFPSGIL
jgi:hypothetical protein